MRAPGNECHFATCQFPLACDSSFPNHSDTPHSPVGSSRPICVIFRTKIPVLKPRDQIICEEIEPDHSSVAKMVLSQSDLWNLKTFVLWLNQAHQRLLPPRSRPS